MHMVNVKVAIIQKLLIEQKINEDIKFTACFHVPVKVCWKWSLSSASKIGKKLLFYNKVLPWKSVWLYFL